MKLSFFHMEFMFVCVVCKHTYLHSHLKMLTIMLGTKPPIQNSNYTINPIFHIEYN